MDDIGYEPPSSSSSSSSDEWPEEKDSRYRTSTRRVLVHVLARKERDAKQMQQLLRVTFAKLEQESQRATDAERRAAQYLVRARTAIDAQALAETETARTREELGMYKVQLEQAQREILRAQDLLNDVDERLREAEESAARARTVARQLKEERVVEAARDEGRRMGWRDGVRKGWAMGWEEGSEERTARDDARSRKPRPPRNLQETLPSGGLPPPQAVFVRPPSPPSPPSSRSPSSSTSSMVEVFSRPPETGNGMRNVQASHGHAPSVPTLTTPFRTPAPTPTPTPDFMRSAHVHRHRPSESSRPPTAGPSRHRTPEPRRSHQGPDPVPVPILQPPRPYTPAAGPSRPYTPHSDAPSSIHPIPIHNVPQPSIHRPVSVPPDGWIPLAQDDDGDGRLSILLPPPHELSDAMRSQEGIDDIQTSAPPSPAPSPPPSMPYPGSVQAGDGGYFDRQMQAPVPVALVPQGIVPVFSNHSRASTRLSDYELLAPVSESRSKSSLGRRQMPVVEDEAGPVRAPSRAGREAPPSRPASSHASHHRNREDYRPRRGPPRPREIVFPAPLGPAVDQLAEPDRADQPAHAPPPRQESPLPPRSDAQAAPSRPPRNRAPSSGLIPITVEPPSPGHSPPSPGNQDVTSQPDLLSPEHALNPLPIPILDLADLPRNPTPVAESSTASEPNRPPRRPRSASRKPTYDAAPMPPGFEYPSSPLAVSQPQPPPPPATGAAKVKTRREEQPEPEPPLSPLSTEGFLNMVFPGRMPWRRNTTRK